MLITAKNEGKLRTSGLKMAHNEKKIGAPFFLYQMGWVKPRKHFHATVPLSL
jgi:hypothetical protein